MGEVLLWAVSDGGLAAAPEGGPVSTPEGQGLFLRWIEGNEGGWTIFAQCTGAGCGWMVMQADDDGAVEEIRAAFLEHRCEDCLMWTAMSESLLRSMDIPWKPHTPDIEPPLGRDE